MTHTHTHTHTESVCGVSLFLFDKRDKTNNQMPKINRTVDRVHVNVCVCVREGKERRRFMVRAGFLSRGFFEVVTHVHVFKISHDELIRQIKVTDSHPPTPNQNNTQNNNIHSLSLFTVSSLSQAQTIMYT